MLFRLPFADREKRAALPAEERLFWYVVLSLSWSIIAVLVMSALEIYRYERLLILNAIVAANIIEVGRKGLRFGRIAARPTWTCLLPIALVALGVWRFFPSAEYIIGGK